MASRRLPLTERQRLGLPADTFADADVLTALKNAGASDAVAGLLWAIGWAESGYVTGIENVNDDRTGSTPNSVDRGPWQINSQAWPAYSSDECHRLASAARIALVIFASQGATAWVAYKKDKTDITRRAASAPFPQDRNTNSAVANRGAAGITQWQRDAIAVAPGSVANSDGTITTISGSTFGPDGRGGTVNPQPVAPSDPPGSGVASDGGPLFKPGTSSIWDKFQAGAGIATEGAKAGVEGIVNPFASLVGGLGTLLGAITSLDFWRRAGIIVLAVAGGLVGVALILKGN